MADLPQVLEHLASGLLSGGAAALTTVFGAFRDMRKRIKSLEDVLGQSAPEATGLHRALEAAAARQKELGDSVAKLQKGMEEWEDDPPDWVMRMLSRARASSSVNLEVLQEFESRMDLRMRALQDRIMRELEDTRKELDSLKKETRDRAELYVTREAYSQDSHRRAKEISAIKENLAAANGLLRGVMGVVGLVGGKGRE